MRFYRQSADKRLPRTAESCYLALKARYITKEDGELYNRTVKKAIKDSSGCAYDLLIRELIKRSDGEIFSEVVEKAIENSKYAYYLLEDKIITKSDGELFKKVVEKAIEDTYDALVLLEKKIITKSDGEIFNKTVKKAIEIMEFASDLLLEKIVTKSDGEIFKKAVERAIIFPSTAFRLLSDKTITKSDVSPELWEEALASAEERYPETRQKFASNTKKAGTVNFKGAFNEYYFPFKNLPFVYLLDDDVLSRDNFVKVWNDNNPDNPINDVDETYDNEYLDKAYNDYLNDSYETIIDDVEEYINTLDLPSNMLIEIIDGYYEGIQLYVNGSDQGIIDMFENEWYELHKNELADDEDFYINGLSEEHQKSLDKYIESRWPELEKQIAEYLRQIAKNFGWNIAE